MPKLTHKVPKYRLHSGSGQAIVTLSGRNIYLGKHGSAQSKREYDRLVGEWATNGRMMAGAGGDFAIAELIAAYWTFAQKYFPGSSGAATLRSIKLALRVLKKLYADTDADDFGPLALQTVQNEMVKEKWSRKYVNLEIGHIRRLFKWGASREMVSGETWQALRSVDPLKSGKTDAREIDPITTVDDEFVDAVLPWLSRHVRAMVELQQITGMRPGELVIMRGVDITTKNPKLWEYRPAEHKTKSRGHERIIYLNTIAQDIIKPFLKSDVSACIFDPREAEEERRATISEQRKTPLSCGNRPGSNVARKPRRAPGERYDVDSYRRAITRACDLADQWEKGGRVLANNTRMIPRWHPHQIRHNTATKLRAKHGLEAAQVILGHRTLSAAQIYAEKNIEKARQIMLEGA